MKRCVFFILVLLLLIGPLAFGQNYWGAKLGINAGTFYGDDADADDWDADSKSARGGFVGGAFFDSRLGERFDIRPELLSSGKGANYESDGGDVNFIIRTLEVPILLQFFLPTPTDVLDVAVFAGPAPALLYTTKYEYSSPFDVGVTFGLGVGASVGYGFLF